LDKIPSIINKHEVLYCAVRFVLQMKF